MSVYKELVNSNEIKVYLLCIYSDKLNLNVYTNVKLNVYYNVKLKVYLNVYLNVNLMYV